MVVVSNASPIISLASIGQLDILEQLYGEVVIPTSVYREIAVVGEGQPGANEVATLPWIVREQVSDPDFTASLRQKLDEGEAEAIALAIQEGADLILLDERRGRQVAATFNLRILGTLGILIQAKRQGLVGRVKPLLDDLTAKFGFWVSPDLYAVVLVSADEQTRS